MRRTILLGIGVLIVLYIVVQLLVVFVLENNPPTVSEPPWDSPQTRALAVRACFDCHSNETNWPWYARLTPAGWLAAFDTIRGRNHLNFSAYQPGQPIGEGEREGGRRGGNEIARVIQDGSMPPWYYLLLHPDAKLTPAEQQQLIQGLQASLK